MNREQIIGRIERYGILIILVCVSAISLGLFSWEVNHWPILTDYVTKNALTSRDQMQILGEVVSSLLVISATMCVFLTVCLLYKFKEDAIKITINGFLKFLSFLFLIPLVLHKDIWKTVPFTMVAIVSLLSLYLYCTVRKARIPGIPFLKKSSSISNSIIYLFLTLFILAYASYFSYYTILNHYQFGTHTFDFGLNQNAFINTLHGDFMAVSYYNGRCLFWDHYDFIYLLYLPFFYFFPKSETLFIIQSISIALAAFPLFLLGRKILKSNFAPLLVVLAFLLHPANHGANFCDIHQLSFLSLGAFSLFYFLEKKNIFAFIASVFFILIIKEDMHLLLLFLSLFIYLNNKNDLKFAAYCFLSGVLYGGFLTFIDKNWGLTSHFSYYEGIILNKSGGIGELFKTFITNPMYILHTVLTKDKIFYFCQMFGPIVFIPLIRKQNFLLFIYGLAITLMATRIHLYQISFQYVWYIVPFLFIGLLYALKDIQTNDNSLISTPKTLQGKVYPLLVAILFATLIYSWQYGAVLNRKYFKGGSREIDFEFTLEDKKRLQILEDIIAHIPRTASVSASETLSTHLITHGNIKRFLELNTEPDYLLLNDPTTERPDHLEYLKSDRGYKVIYRMGGFQLLKKSP